MLMKMLLFGRWEIAGFRQRQFQLVLQLVKLIYTTALGTIGWLCSVALYLVRLTSRSSDSVIRWMRIDAELISKTLNGLY